MWCSPRRKQQCQLHSSPALLFTGLWHLPSLRIWTHSFSLKRVTLWLLCWFYPSSAVCYFFHNCNILIIWKFSAYPAVTTLNSRQEISSDSGSLPLLWNRMSMLEVFLHPGAFQWKTPWVTCSMMSVTTHGVHSPLFAIQRPTHIPKQEVITFWEISSFVFSWKKWWVNIPLSHPSTRLIPGVTTGTVKHNMCYLI